MRKPGSFVALNNVVSQSVPHLHVHVVPRKPKDGLRGFFWPRTKYDSEESDARGGRAGAEGGRAGLASFALPEAGEPNGMVAVTLTDAFDLPRSLLFPALFSLRTSTCWPEASDRPLALPMVALPSLATRETPSTLVLALIATSRPFLLTFESFLLRR